MKNKNKNNWFDLPKRVNKLEDSTSGIEVFDPNKDYNEGDIVLKVGEGIFRKTGSETGIKVLSEQFFGSAEGLIDHPDSFPWKVYMLEESDLPVIDYDSFVDFTNNNMELILAEVEAGGQTTIEGLFLYKGGVYNLTLEFLTEIGWETLLINNKSFTQSHMMDLNLSTHSNSEVKAIKDYIYDNLIDVLKVGDTVRDNQTYNNTFLTVVANDSLRLRLVGYFFRGTTGPYSEGNMLRTDIELNLQKDDRNGTQTYCRAYEADTVYRAYSLDIKEQ